MLKYDYPYADGYTGFWKSPISVQHPLAVSEIVAWDGMYILLIAENDESVNTFMKKKKMKQRVRYQIKFLRI